MENVLALQVGQVMTVQLKFAQITVVIMVHVIKIQKPVNVSLDLQVLIVHKFLVWTIVIQLDIAIMEHVFARMDILGQAANI